MSFINLKKVVKVYPDGTQAIFNSSLSIEKGELVVFVGPSGCGKSTLLRMIAGLEDVTEGEIDLDGNRINEIDPSERDIAMVFQNYALYPHMSVYNNIAYGLRSRGVKKLEIEAQVTNVSELLQIGDLLSKKPGQLSGGQRQRVAMGRAIARDPKVFLFDEPLSNLDASLRVQTRIEISKLHERLGSTMIYVTHDQVEAMTLADKIVVLKDGRVEQIGSPTELYDQPQNLFVAGFIGSPKMNFFNRMDVSEITQKNMQNEHTIGIRPEHLVACAEADACVSGKLELIENLGEYVLAHMVGSNGTTFIAKMDRKQVGNIGDTLAFKVVDGNAHMFDRTSTQRV